jgi:hypothetical protein
VQIADLARAKNNLSAEGGCDAYESAHRRPQQDQLKKGKGGRNNDGPARPKAIDEQGELVGAT